MRGFGKLPALLALACAGILATGWGQASRLTGDGLHSLLEQALEAFSKNDFRTAADLFQRLERDFGSEAEFQDATFLRRMLPLKGHAEITAGLPTAAAKTFAQFVDSFPNDPQHAGALYALGIALQRDGQAMEAAGRFKQFTTTYPRRPEAALALVQRAEILFALGEGDEALQLLDAFSTSEAPAVLRHQARMRAARRMLEKEDLSASVRLLLDYPWNVQAMPEIAALCFAALELGDRLVEAENFDDAIRAYRLVLPRVRLIELQERHIREIRDRLRGAAVAPGRFWNDYYRGLLDAMTRQVAALKEGDDYTPALLLRRGQAMLLVDRHHEAWLLFERLALDESLPASMREEAHYRWIVAASGLELWEEALTLARNYLARYPDAPLAPQTIYLVAQAHQEQRRYEEAAKILADLLARFPGHALAQRWRFTHGFNRALLEDFAGARIHFRRAVDDFPDGPLTPNAELWHALTFFFERDYKTALAEFDRLAGRYEKHPLAGEILYRRASTLYAIREYERAESETAGFVERFQRHQRHGEALVLLGDIRMGTGDLDGAMAAFERLEPGAGHIFLYGLFQQGKILRAQQAYEKMIALFSRHTERSDLEEKPRLSEALYWIGWAHTQLNQTAEAAPFFLSALERHGDDPASAEIGSILGLLERMHPLPGSTERSFSSWLEAERQKALSAERLTYFSRLTLHLAQIKRRQNLPHQAESLLFEIASDVPVEKLGPEALGQVGRLMSEKELETAEYFFRALLKDYPHAPERAFAYHGFGKGDFARGNFENALVWLRRFENETATHPLASEVLQLIGESLVRLERYDEATAKFDEILRLRSLRGRPHAAALIGLADATIAIGEREKAVAYYQRVYTVHRAQADLVAKAYFESGALFEELGDKLAAHRTFAEMLSLEELSGSPYFEQARERERSLAPQAAALAAAKTESSHVE